MSAVCIIDTSVFCHILNVFRRDAEHARAVAELRAMVADEHTLLLPLATIYETGNHIAQNGDGRVRRRTAELFVQQVRAAFAGTAPWSPTLVPEPEDFMQWLAGFPDHAARGVGMGDLSIIQAWEQQCALNQGRRVYIWTYDEHLRGYDQRARL